MKRREFLKSAVFTALALELRGSSLPAENTNALIEVLIDEPLGTISPNIYGHFTEHLGGVIYDGVWVGTGSPIANIGGIRKSLVEALRRIKAPVIRWPGGCFADSYDWKDGIGPREKRPRRTNFWVDEPDMRRLHNTGVQLIDDNAFGTGEFLRFCRLSGAEPYIAANLRSLPALDFDRWIEYCNSPRGTTTLADERAAGGNPEPFYVRYWGIGNESWGCGGLFIPEAYASEFRRFTSWVPSYGVALQLIGSGPSDDDMDWTHRFFENIFGGERTYKNPAFVGWSIHHYSSAGKGNALQFTDSEWYELFQSGFQTEKIIQDQWEVMGQYDQSHRIKLVVDEYGPWHEEGTEVDPTHLFGQQITIRDALLTAFTLDIFNRHPEKLMMANCAQLINNLNALFLAHGDKFLSTPNYDVFDMYASHQGAQSLRTIFSASSISYEWNGKESSFWGLNGSASLNGKVLTITAVNPAIGVPRETEISMRGGAAKSATITTLIASDIHAHNTFENPNAVRSKTSPLAGADGQTLHITLPPASVTKLEVQLA